MPTKSVHDDPYLRPYRVAHACICILHFVTAVRIPTSIAMDQSFSESTGDPAELLVNDLRHVISLDKVSLIPPPSSASRWYRCDRRRCSRRAAEQLRHHPKRGPSRVGASACRQLYHLSSPRRPASTARIPAQYRHPCVRSQQDEAVESAQRRSVSEQGESQRDKRKQQGL